MRAIIRPGYSAKSASGANPHFSIVPGLKFSISMSALPINLRTKAWPSGMRKLAETDFLLRATTSHCTFSAPWPQTRIGSPAPGGSTLMTSAPMSPSNWPQKGPASSCPSSTTRNPLSALTRQPPALSILAGRGLSIRFPPHNWRAIVQCPDRN